MHQKQEPRSAHFVDLPTKKKIKDILKVHIQKRIKNPKILGQFQLSDGILDSLARQSEGFVGAEIEQIVIETLFEAYSENRSINLEDFEKAISNTVPLSVTQSEQIRSIREWANVRAVTATPQEDLKEYNSDDLSKDIDTNDVRFNRGGRTIDF